jgi:ribosomal protein S18 acetylase RimI-like enzyme
LIRQRGTFNEQEVRVAMELVDAALKHPEKGDYRFLCAIDGHRSLAGYICYGPIPMTDGCYDLYWIAVDEQCSRKGVGRKLLEQMEAILYDDNARRIYLDTSSTLPYKAARSFYEKNGYRPVCVLNDFYRRGDHKMIWMKELKKIGSSSEQNGNS